MVFHARRSSAGSSPIVPCGRLRDEIATASEAAAPLSFPAAAPEDRLLTAGEITIHSLWRVLNIYRRFFRSSSGGARHETHTLVDRRKHPVSHVVAQQNKTLETGEKEGHQHENGNHPCQQKNHDPHQGEKVSKTNCRQSSEHQDTPQQCVEAASASSGETAKSTAGHVTSSAESPCCALSPHNLQAQFSPRLKWDIADGSLLLPLIPASPEAEQHRKTYIQLHEVLMGLPPAIIVSKRPPPNALPLDTLLYNPHHSQSHLSFPREGGKPPLALRQLFLHVPLSRREQAWLKALHIHLTKHFRPLPSCSPRGPGARFVCRSVQPDASSGGVAQHQEGNKTRPRMNRGTCSRAVSEGNNPSATTAAEQAPSNVRSDTEQRLQEGTRAKHSSTSASTHQTSSISSSHPGGGTKGRENIFHAVSSTKNHSSDVTYSASSEAACSETDAPAGVSKIISSPSAGFFDGTNVSRQSSTDSMVVEREIMLLSGDDDDETVESLLQARAAEDAHFAALAASGGHEGAGGADGPGSKRTDTIHCYGSGLLHYRSRHSTSGGGSGKRSETGHHHKEETLQPYPQLLEPAMLRVLWLVYRSSPRKYNPPPAPPLRREDQVQQQDICDQLLQGHRITDRHGDSVVTPLDKEEASPVSSSRFSPRYSADGRQSDSFSLMTIAEAESVPPEAVARHKEQHVAATLSSRGQHANARRKRETTEQEEVHAPESCERQVTSSTDEEQLDSHGRYIDTCMTPEEEAAEAESLAAEAIAHVMKMVAFRREMFPLSDANAELDEDLNKGVLYWTGRDVAMRPVLVLNLRRLDAALTELSRFLRLLLFVFEWGLRFMMVPGKVETCVVMFDVREVSLWSLPYKCLQVLVQTLTVQYPFRLRKMFVLHNSRLITGFWNVAKVFLTDVQQSKIATFKVEKACTNPELLAQVHALVPPSQLEEKYGGNRENIEEGFYPFPIAPAHALPRKDAEGQFHKQQVSLSGLND